MSITESIRTTVHVHFKKSVKSAIFWKWKGSKSNIWHKFCFHDAWVGAWFCYWNYNIARKRHSANSSNAHRLVQVGGYDESGFHIFPSKGRVESWSFTLIPKHSKSYGFGKWWRERLLKDAIPESIICFDFLRFLICG